jgi:hypothetical protein
MDPVVDDSVVPDPVVPDYESSVAAIVPSLLGLTDNAWLPAPTHDAASVVLLVVDGLGWRAFADAPNALANLNEFVGGPTTTVVPATTAAALTAITTGRSPVQHGLLGFRMRVDDAVLNVLRWQIETRGVKPPDPTVVQPNSPFFGRAIPVVAKAEHQGSGFTEAHLRGGPFVGWRATSTIVEHCRRLVAEGHPFVYAYYPCVDEVAHEFGLHDGAYAAELAFADDLVGRLRAALPDSCALVVTADHGQMHIEPEDWIELDPEIEALIELQAGDARCRYLYARSGAHQDLAAACRERFARVAWVRTRRELLDEAWMGVGASGSIPGRIGDVVLMPFAPVGFVDRALPRERGLRSAHGAPTAAEMTVPLLAARGTA